MTTLAAASGLAVAAPAGAAIETFRATLTPDAVVPINGAPAPDSSDASAAATFVLDTSVPNEPTLAYAIVFSNFDAATEMQALHFHLGPPIANGPHVLNVFGLPRVDDADAVLDGNVLTGLWDNGDENFGPDGVRDGIDSVALSDVLVALRTGDLYVQVHSFEFPVPNTGEMRGQIVVPEPAA
ncbi:MAG: CHRD domain-containing protein, partial [Planctomycetota bacterium]